MAVRDVLYKAERALRARRFPKVLSLLEPRVIDYRESFRFFYILGVACLYVGDIGGAESYFKRARQIHVNDPALQLAYAALFIRRGETDRAIDCCFSVLEECPSNKKAKKLLRFIRTKGKPESVAALVATGKIKKCYPDLGIPPVFGSVALVCGIIAAAGALCFCVYGKTVSASEQRADLSGLYLTADEKKNPLEKDLSSGVFRYILLQQDVDRLYASAQQCFQKYDDNGAQIAVNRLLGSNASAAVKQKARLLMEYLAEPTFDSMLNGKSRQLTYKEVAQDPYLYMDCWIVWSGRVANLQTAETDVAGVKISQPVECNFLIGYDTMQHIDGIVPLLFSPGMQIETDRPVKVLAKISMRDGYPVLQGKSVYQPVSEK